MMFRRKKENGKHFRITAQEIARIGVMTATLEAVKLALSFLPNVELVTLFIILYTLFFGKKTIYAIAAFIFIEGIHYGFGLWWFMYVYIWPLLAGLTYLFRKQESVWFWSIFSGCYGLFFGGLCSLVYLFFGGPRTAFSWWIAGIPYDIVHCVSNFIVCSILFRPLHQVLKRVEQQS